MDFLKTILGDDLYAQVESKVNAYNSDETNKDKQIKIANLTSGEYISKNKFTDLETEKGNISTQLDAANKLIEDLKKSSKGDETLQQKVSEYETEISSLKSELEQTKIDSALKVALYGAKASDVDYLLFKIKEKGEEIKLDDKGNVKGVDEIISSLKTQLPAQFETELKGGKKIEPIPLPKSDDNRGAEPKDLAEAIEQSYKTHNE